MNKQTFTIPENCTTVTVEQIENKLIATFEAKFEPKDGDFCVNRHSSIFIYQSVAGNDSCNHRLWWNAGPGHILSTDGGTTSPPIRLATESEKQQLLDALAKDGKKWNAELKRVEKLRWRAEREETYAFVSGIGRVVIERDNRSYLDNARYNIGNYFEPACNLEKYQMQIESIYAENL